MSGTMGSGRREVRTRSSGNLHRLPVRLRERFGHIDTRKMGCPKLQNRKIFKAGRFLVEVLSPPPKKHLHMRPIQWHLKANWHVPESLEKPVLSPKSVYKHLEWWLQEENILVGQPLHPLQHTRQIFTDTSNVGYGVTKETSQPRVCVLYQKANSTSIFWN